MRRATRFDLGEQVRRRPDRAPRRRRRQCQRLAAGARQHPIASTAATVQPSAPRSRRAQRACSRIEDRLQAIDVARLDQHPGLGVSVTRERVDLGGQHRLTDALETCCDLAQLEATRRVRTSGRELEGEARALGLDLTQSLAAGEARCLAQEQALPFRVEDGIGTEREQTCRVGRLAVFGVEPARWPLPAAHRLAGARRVTALLDADPRRSRPRARRIPSAARGCPQTRRGFKVGLTTAGVSGDHRGILVLLGERNPGKLAGLRNPSQGEASET